MPSFHRRQAEFFKVVRDTYALEFTRSRKIKPTMKIQGRVCYVLDGKEGVALPGSIVDLPEGRVHSVCSLFFSHIKLLTL